MSEQGSTEARTGAEASETSPQGVSDSGGGPVVPRAASRGRKAEGESAILDAVDAARLPDALADGDLNFQPNHKGPPLPRGLGFSIEKMNEDYALVLLGSKAVIYFERKGAPLDDQQRFLTIEAFRAWLANKYTELAGSGGKVKAITWANAWLQNHKRRSFSGVEFFPDRDNALGTEGYLNLWSGFAVKPAPKPHGYRVFRDHLLNNVCGGDKQTFEWVFAFFADIVQNPRGPRAGVALVMRGRMGAGKTKVGETIGSLFPRHYFLVDDPRYVVGQFNAHMASCLLLQGDEAMWAGDKAAEGRLKGLITSPIQQIEAKGIDPIRLKNHVRVILTSNEDWVVPAGKDERRFCVLDVDPRCAQNHEYFSEMDAELDDGGREALLADLLAFDLSRVNLRQIPRTEALLEQKIRSLNSIESWWLERLMEGSPTKDGIEWPRLVPKSSLVNDYLSRAEKVGIRRRATEIEIGITLAKLVPGLGTERPWLGDEGGSHRRVWCCSLPPLEACRAAFQELVQQTVEWLEVGAPESAEHE